MRIQRVRKLEERSSVRVLTKSECLSDEIYIRDCDQKDQKKRDIGYDCYSTKGLLYHIVSKEMKMRERNLTPILMLRAGSTISGERLVDQWRKTEETAGSRLEAWDDLTGLSLDPKGVLAARRQELEYISQKQVLGGSTPRRGEAQPLEDYQTQMD